MRHQPTPILFRILLTLSIGCLAVALSACNHSSKPEDTPALTLHTTAMQSKISLDPTLPPIVIGAVSKVVSPFQEGTPGTIISIPSSGGNGDTLVFAMDAQGNVLLAADTTDTSTVLSVESTAVALVRMALGVVPDQISVSQLNTEIRTTAAFAHLVSSISAALAIPSAPAADASVQSGIGDVLVQLGPILASKLPVKSPTNPTLLASVQYYPSILSPFPYSLTNSGADRVEITNANYLVANRSLIIYSIVSSASPSEILLSAAPITGRLVGDLNTTTLSNNGGNGFNVTVGQTNASKHANVVAIGSDLLANLIGKILGEQKSLACLISAEKAFLLPKDIEPVILSPSAATFATLVNNAVSPSNVRSIVKNCVDLSNTTGFSADFAKAFIGISSGYYEAKMIVQGVGLMFELVQFRTAVNRAPITNGVCETVNSGVPAIVNCAKGFKFDPEPQMTVGQTLTPNVVAVDINDLPTALPAHLEFSSMNPDLATVDPRTGAVTAVMDGVSLIRITDPSTGQYSAAGVRIGPIQGAIFPSNPSVAVGSTLQLTARFTDSSGNVISPPSALLWSSPSENVVRIDPNTGLVTGVATGTSFVTVKLQGTNTSITTSVTVGVVDAIATIKITSTSCTSVSPPPQGPRYTNKFTATGQITGPVGAYLGSRGVVKEDSPDGPGFAQSGDEGGLTATCAAWTLPNGLCARQSNQPATTTFQFSGLTTDPEYAFAEILYQAPATDRPSIVAEARAPLSCPSD